MLEDSSLSLTEDQKDFLYKRYFIALTKACEVGGEFPWLLVTEVMNRANFVGLADKYPEEFGKFLEVSVLKGGRPEFFDALYTFRKRRGEVDRLYQFIISNMDHLIQVNMWATDAFKELIYRSNGYELRMVFGEAAYRKRGKIMDKAAYLMRVLLLANGDYVAAKKVLREIESAAKQFRKVAEHLSHQF